jgi:hypothetical protein
LEDAGVDFDLLDARAVELFESGNYTGFLSCTGGTVDEEVREVAILSLLGVMLAVKAGEEMFRESYQRL